MKTTDDSKPNGDRMDTLPTWDEMTDRDKGAALLHLSKAEHEGVEYATSDYPAEYFDHPALTALDEETASSHARGLFDDNEAAWDKLGGEEYERLYDLALDEDRKRFQVKTATGRPATRSRVAEEIQVGDIVRSEHLATDAGGEELKDCEVTNSYRTTLGGWAIEWRMVADETVTGTLLTNPSVAIEVVS